VGEWVSVCVCVWERERKSVCLCARDNHEQIPYPHARYSRSHLGWHFRMLFQSSELKARTSLFTETWQKRRSSFELWAFGNVTASGIGCTYRIQSMRVFIDVCLHAYVCNLRWLAWQVFDVYSYRYAYIYGIHTLVSLHAWYLYMYTHPNISMNICIYELTNVCMYVVLRAWYMWAYKYIHIQIYRFIHIRTNPLMMQIYVVIYTHTNQQMYVCM